MFSTTTVFILEPEVYIQLALRTLAPEQMHWNFDGSEAELAKRRLLTNAALGLAGESAEVSLTPTSDECGDAYWYAYVLMQGLEIFPLRPDPFRKKDENFDPTPARLMKEACIVCELIKKYVFHNKSLDSIRPKIVKNLQNFIDIVAAIDENEPEATFKQNIDKLKKRYPDGFKSLDISD